MASLNTKVTKYLEANSKTFESEQNNFLLQNDGSGDYIKTWNVSGLAKPSDDEIASYEEVGNTAETLAAVLNKRRQEYPSIPDQTSSSPTLTNGVLGNVTWPDAP